MIPSNAPFGSLPASDSAPRAGLARAVDPAPAADTRHGPDPSRTVVDLIAPDPAAPTGPPPAFDSSPLERERERALADPAHATPRLLEDLRAVRAPGPPSRLDIVV